MIPAKIKTAAHFRKTPKTAEIVLSDRDPVEVVEERLARFLANRKTSPAEELAHSGKIAGVTIARVVILSIAIIAVAFVLFTLL